MKIVERIKIKIKEKNSSIKALEKEIGIGNGTIARWNEKSPTLENLEKVANNLQVTLDWLVYGKENKDLTEEERTLLDAYRIAPKEYKTAARRVLLIPDQEQIPESEQTKSSISKIG